MSETEIYIVEACRPQPGDLVVLCTNESLSHEQSYQLRGKLVEKLDAYGVDFLIVCGSDMIHFKKDEVNQTIIDYLKEIKK